MCKRCTKSQRICLAASPAKQACFSIHVENCYASGRIKRPRGPRSSLTVLRPHFDLQTRALAYYLQYHLQTLTDLPDVAGGLSESVSAWQVSGRKCPMVDLALSSMALAVFSRTQHHPPAATEASSRYHRLLWVAQEQIAQIGSLTFDERSIDACLLAVVLMGWYEVTTHHPDDVNSKHSFTSLQNWSHHDGAMAILKVWNDHPSHNTATFIIKQARRGLIRSSLLRNLPLPDWVLNGSRFGEQDLELAFDGIIVRTVKLHYASTSLQPKNGLKIAENEKLNYEARELDKALQDWAAQISSTCSYQRHILTESDQWPKEHFYSSIVYSHSSPGYAAVRSQYLAARILLNSTRLRVLELSRPNLLAKFTYEEQRLECIAQLKDMADSLASTIPFCLERFTVDRPSSLAHHDSITLNTNEEIKPYLVRLVAWPLSIASSAEGIDDRQQLWFKSELASLGRIIGDGTLECAEADHWPKL